ncbi:MAG: hypothetical protein HYR91_09610 [Flavobacteriia bacterium]|jgi:hypothetical protein|nr:hypothetical protein [Flavobacteriia bacterium]
MGVIERMKAPTPKFFKVLRNIGLGLAATGGALIATPIAMPAMVVLIGQYLVVAGTVASAVAQTVVSNEE